MKASFKGLLEHMIAKNFCAEDVVVVVGHMKSYVRARVDFNKAQTPESTALARWSLEDARREWHKCVREYNLPIGEIDYYF